MSLAEPLYKRDISILKDYGGQGYKLTTHNVLRTSGLDVPLEERAERCTANEFKLDENIIRARSKLLEYALCNPWEFFLTITLNKDKYDRYNLDKFNSDLKDFIKNYNKKYNLNIKRVFVPEMHLDGAWHMHGLFMGLPKEHLREFTLDEKLPDYIRQKLIKGEKIFEWVAYREKFGFNDFEIVRSRRACAFYCLKYITKNLDRSVQELNKHLFYPSKGLNTAKEIKRGSLTVGAIKEPDWSNDYVSVKWYDGNFSLEYLNSLFE